MSKPPHRDHAERADPETLLRSVLAGLPGAAAAMYTLMTVGPEAREPLFRHVSDAAAGIDRDRSALMAAVKDLPLPRRAPAILVAQTVSLLASMMVATARVAAQGRPDALPSRCEEAARTIVELADQAALSFPRQRGDHVPPELDSPTAGTEYVLRLLADVSDQLDQLLGALTANPRAVPQSVSSPPVRPPTIHAQASV